MAITKIEVRTQDTKISTLSQDNGVSLLLLEIGPDTTTTPDSLSAEGDEVVKDIPLTKISEVESLENVKDLEDFFKNTVVDPSLVHQITDFTSQAGSKILWIATVRRGIDNAKIEQAEIEKLIKQTGAASIMERARLVGYCFSNAVNATVDDVTHAIENLGNAYENLQLEGYRFASIVGYNNSAKITSESNVVDPEALNKHSVAVCLSSIDSEFKNSACVGFALGQLAAANIDYNIGNCMLGSAGVAHAYQTDSEGTDVASMSQTYFDTLGSKQFLFLRTRPMMSGYYWNDDATATSAENALSQISTNRILNSLADSCQEFLGHYINTTALANDDGTLSEAYSSGLENEFYNSYILPAINKEYIADGELIVKAKANNIVQTKTLECTLKVYPNASIREISAIVSFEVKK